MLPTEATGTRIVRLVVKGLELTVSTMLVCMCLSVFLGVFCRYFLHIGLGWTEEAARYLQIWIMFLGAAIGVRRSAHFRMSIVEDRLEPPARRRLAVLANVAITAFAVGVAWHGVHLSAATWEQQSPMMGWSIGRMYLAVPLSGALMALFASINVAKSLGGEDLAPDHAVPQPHAGVACKVEA